MIVSLPPPYLHNLMRLLSSHLASLCKQVLDVNQTNTIIEYVDTGQKSDVSHVRRNLRRRAVTPLTPSLHHLSQEDRREGGSQQTNKQTNKQSSFIFQVKLLLKIVAAPYFEMLFNKYWISIYLVDATPGVSGAVWLAVKILNPRPGLLHSQEITQATVSALLTTQGELENIVLKILFTLIVIFHLRSIWWRQGNIHIYADVWWWGCWGWRAPLPCIPCTRCTTELMITRGQQPLTVSVSTLPPSATNQSWTNKY